MKIFFIRHGEPNYEKVADLSLVSYLGELSFEGITQAEGLLERCPELSTAGVILSSPFTRSLQTAAILSRRTGIRLIVEPALHEWLADKSHLMTLNEDYGKAAYHEFLEKNGIRDDKCRFNWESAESVANRAFTLFKHYHDLKYDKIVVVAHAMLIRTFGYSKQKFPYCSVYEYEFTEDSKYEGFVPWNG